MSILPLLLTLKAGTNHHNEIKRSRLQEEKIISQTLTDGRVPPSRLHSILSCPGLEELQLTRTVSPAFTSTSCSETCKKVLFMLILKR